MNLTKRIEDLQNDLNNILNKKSLYTELVIEDLIKLYKKINDCNK